MNREVHVVLILETHLEYAMNRFDGEIAFGDPLKFLDS